jgi:hypothetical protein
MATLIKSAALDSLTSKQLERYYYLFPLFGEDAFTIVQLLAGGRGKNSWNVFQEKLNEIINAPLQDREYYNTLYESFELDRPYKMDEIIQNVSTVRSDMKLESFGEAIKLKCETDFLRLFLTENVYDVDASASVRRKVLGYTPIYKIKPE